MVGTASPTSAHGATSPTPGGRSLGLLETHRLIPEARRHTPGDLSRTLGTE